MENKIINAIFISEDIETRIVFRNVLEQLDQKITVDYFFQTDAACALMNRKTKCSPEFIFLNASNDKDTCLREIDAIKQYAQKNHCKIVMFDSYSVLKETSGIFSMGVDVFLPKPYDFIPLKKALRDIIFPNATYPIQQDLYANLYEF